MAWKVRVTKVASRKLRKSVTVAEAKEFLAKIQETQREYQELLASQGQELIAALAADMFEKNPGLLTVKWDQYTPSFNDGDPCTFSIHEPRVKFTKEFYDSLTEEEKTQMYRMDEDDAESPHLDFYEMAYYGRKKSKLKAVNHDLIEFYRAIQKVEDIMVRCFGDPVEVSIDRDGSIHSTECNPG